MGYKSLNECISDLNSVNELKKIKEEINPELEMASIHLEEFTNDGKAILFENIKNCNYRAVSNIFGSSSRSRYIFRDSLKIVKDLIAIKTNPIGALKNFPSTIFAVLNGIYALPKKVRFQGFEEITINDLPQIKCWKDDGGSFITLPQVYSEDIDNPGILNSNLGMYRIQLTGNDYILNKEIGMHYQLHRGIGVHQKKANIKGKPLKVSIFIGGPPAHTFAAVMPLPEGMSEISFAGVLGKKRFRYSKKEGYTISADADFVICGELHPNELKPEGPFGDHLGYYSLKHDFPFLRVHKVYAKKNGIWPFTVVGRPPQEDSQFGSLIHDITDNVIEKEIPGLKSVNAVDESGVHPLLLAVGSERYTPYNPVKQPQEILTIANHILGTGQMSLAKYLFICDDETIVDVNDEKAYFTHFLQRVDWKRDLHFQTKTTIDTLDYSGDDLNKGSKLVLAAAGDVKRKLIKDISYLSLSKNILNARIVSPGNLVVEGNGSIEDLVISLQSHSLEGIALITIVDDAIFTAEDFSNWLWVTFTRSNPANDMHGLNSQIINKHFSCTIPVIDARIKPHHAPVLKR
ncbi:MAG: UbiD family decarboxylase [Flavobacteriales bacterium]|nr:UbiD family decarboxylase [Flavobacteriales bacterium]MDG1933295.1 UbiD family decarboxylase [Flavobacteriales bacterium]MDG2086609.1 UbiD family decarboxylase [Flavobacteriales bacterium]